MRRRREDRRCRGARRRNVRRDLVGRHARRRVSRERRDRRPQRRRRGRLVRGRRNGRRRRARRRVSRRLVRRRRRGPHGGRGNRRRRGPVGRRGRRPHRRRGDRRRRRLVARSRVCGLSGRRRAEREKRRHALSSDHLCDRTCVDNRLGRAASNYCGALFRAPVRRAAVCVCVCGLAACCRGGGAGAARRGRGHLGHELSRRPRPQLWEPARPPAARRCVWAARVRPPPRRRGGAGLGRGCFGRRASPGGCPPLPPPRDAARFAPRHEVRAGVISAQLTCLCARLRCHRS